MKKNVFEMVVAMVNGQPVADMDTLRNEINTEYERMNAKRNANKSAYDTAKDVAFGILNDKPISMLSCTTGMTKSSSTITARALTLTPLSERKEKPFGAFLFFTISMLNLC